MACIKKVLSWLTALSLIGPMSFAAEASTSGSTRPDSEALLKQASQMYLNFQSAREMSAWLGKQIPKKEASFLQSQTMSFATDKPLSLRIQGSEAIFGDGKLILALKVIHADMGEYEINHHRVLISTEHLRDSWKAIERALPRLAFHPLVDLLLPRAEAQDSAFLVAIAAMGVLSLHAFLNIAWTDYHLSHGLKVCNETRQSDLLRRGPQNEQEQKSLDQLILEIKTSTSKLNNCTPEANKDEFCEREKKIRACFQDLQALSQQWGSKTGGSPRLAVETRAAAK